MPAALTQERLKELLDYDPLTGVFKWRVKRKGTESSKIAGSPHSRGYVSIVIDYNRYFSHRLAWLFMTGAFPVFQIDHVNGLRDDNRFANLRAATRSQNQHNKKINRNSTSGCKGVIFDKIHGTWRAHITLRGRVVKQRNFHSFEEAVAARRKMVEEIHGEFARHE